jgi:hypothetical protein
MKGRRFGKGEVAFGSICDRRVDRLRAYARHLRRLPTNVLLSITNPRRRFSADRKTALIQARDREPVRSEGQPRRFRFRLAKGRHAT